MRTKTIVITSLAAFCLFGATVLALILYAAHQALKPGPGDDAASGWPTNCTVAKGDLSVTLDVAHSGSDGQEMVMNLVVSNLSAARKVDFKSWKGQEFDFGPGAALTDDAGNRYKIYTGTAGADQDDIYPGDHFLDSLLFEKPVKGYKYLHLKLPAANFGGSGTIRFEVPNGAFGVDH